MPFQFYYQSADKLFPLTPKKKCSEPLARAPAEKPGSPVPQCRGGGRLRFWGAAAEPSTFTHPRENGRRKGVGVASLCLAAWGLSGFLVWLVWFGFCYLCFFFSSARHTALLGLLFLITFRSHHFSKAFDDKLF